MLTIKKALQSSVGKKFIMGISGLALVGFILIHLLGNTTLYFKESTLFNAYVHKLYSLGDFLLVAELGLVALFMVHIVAAFRVTLSNKSARPEKYEVQKSKNGPSKSNITSRNMIVSGVILLGFLVFHIYQFRFGPGMAQGYVTDVNGEPSRDLFKLVIEQFQNPLIVAIYVGVMLFLGMHLRHGFWSAFQSLGAMNPRFTKPI
ncbi:MAG: Succinate dehydrogenase (Or fumarate reductase) cytochrome b subunit, b558 family, partial [uncultured bacterium]